MPVNPAQKEAITFGSGPAMVLAGPGSGKTTVITHRVRYLVEEKKIPPSQILVITFTKAAAREMQERFLRLTGGQASEVTFGTFHAVFFHILKHAYHYNASHIIRPEKKEGILRDLITKTQMEVEEVGELLLALSSEISALKGEGGSLEEYAPKSCAREDFAEIYQGYNEALRKAGLLDFDDMVGLCHELFLVRKDILSAWQKRYQYFLIDEFQDINPMQYEVVRMMAKPSNNIFIVGDDDQSIYRFRGASPEIMLNFPRDYPGCRQILLDINYRSTPQIVDSASCLIGQNSLRFRKKLKAAGENGPTPFFSSFPTIMEENDRILQELQHYHRQGIPYEEMALLYRTNQAPRAMVESLLRMNLPFQMKEVIPNLYDHWIAGDLLTYLMIAAGSRRRADYLRIINRPKRYVERVSFTEAEVDTEKLKEYYRDKEWVRERLERLEYDLRMIARMSPYAAINYIRRGIGYEEYIHSYAEYRKMKPDELMDILDEIHESAGHYATLDEWLEYIREYTRELEEQRQNKQIQGEGVAIATMHGSKGLEYQVVFMPDANEGITPHKRSVLPEEIEEERRLFYVAMTRAKKYLHIYWAKERYHRQVPVSRFVREAGGKAEK